MAAMHEGAAEDLKALDDDELQRRLAFHKAQINVIQNIQLGRQAKLAGQASGRSRRNNGRYQAIRDDYHRLGGQHGAIKAVAALYNVHVRTVHRAIAQGSPETVGVDPTTSETTSPDISPFVPTPPARPETGTPGEDHAQASPLPEASIVPGPRSSPDRGAKRRKTPVNTAPPHQISLDLGIMCHEPATNAPGTVDTKSSPTS